MRSENSCRNSRASPRSFRKVTTGISDMTLMRVSSADSLNARRAYMQEYIEKREIYESHKNQVLVDSN